MVNRTEQGWCGHHICGDRCMFRRNTLLEKDDVHIIVSTVGAARNPLSHGETYTHIGPESYYETQSFHAKYDDPYWDTDVSRQVSVDAKWKIDTIGRKSDKEANDMHEAYVEAMMQAIEEDKFDEC
jgi:hypothetical protein